MKSPLSWRRGITTGISCALFALASLVCAQPGGKVFRIGVLGQGNAPRNAVPAADFRQALHDLGYKTVTLEVRYGEGDADKLTRLADELVRMKVDLIVTIGESAASAAKRATTTIPIIATEFGEDPVKSGLVASLSRPGGNVTGLASISEELWLKRLQMLREFAPKISRIGVVMNPTNRGNVSCLTEIRAAGLGLGMQVRALEISDAKTLEAILAAIAKDPPDAFAMCWDSVTLEHAQAIAAFALKWRLPSVAPVREYVETACCCRSA
jgi:putative ABC transport system substrate-binding protein